MSPRRSLGRFGRRKKRPKDHLRLTNAHTRTEIRHPNADFQQPAREHRGDPRPFFAAFSPKPPVPSICEAYRERIAKRGRNGKAIWQDLVSEHGFAAGYKTVQGFVCGDSGRREEPARSRGLRLLL